MFERFKPPGVRQEDLLERWDDERLLSQLEQNLRLIEALAVVIMKHAVDRLGIEGIDDDTAINPYAIGLDSSKWEEDGLLGGENAISPQHCPGPCRGHRGRPLDRRRSHPSGAAAGASAGLMSYPGSDRLRLRHGASATLQRLRSSGNVQWNANHRSEFD